MIVGENACENDLDVNICKEKKQTDMRAACLKEALSRAGLHNPCPVSLAVLPRLRAVKWDMLTRPSALAGWSPEEVAQARRWVRTWQDAAPRLAEIRRRELRALDPFTAIALLCGPANYRDAPRAPKPTSGLIEQQRLFALKRRR